MTPVASSLQGFASRLRLWRLPVAAATFFRATGIFGKDLVRHSGGFVALMMIAVAVLYLPPFLALLRGQPVPGLTPGPETVSGVFLGMVAAASFFFGLLLTADETESRTYLLLESLPLSERRIFWEKLAAALLLLVVWSLLASVVLGFLSGSPQPLFIAQSTKTVILNYGRSLPITLLQSLSLVLTGLVAGTYFRNLATGAILGMCGYVVFVVLLSHSFDAGKTGDVAADWITSTGLLFWCALMIGLYPAAARRLSRGPAGTVSGEFRSPLWQAVSDGLTLRRAGRAYDPPHRHLLRLPLLLLVPVCAITSFAWPQVVSPNHPAAMTWIFLFPVLAALLGSCCWMAEERIGSRFFLYAIPAPRETLFKQRFAAAGGGALLLGACNFVALTAGIYVQNPEQVTADISSKQYAWGVVVFCVIGTACLSLLGACFRLFFRGLLIPTILGVLTGMAWLVIAAMTLMNTTQVPGLGRFASLPVPWQAVQVLWTLVILIGVPVVVAWVSYCRSRLLETTERTRGSVGLVVFFFLLIWGGFLLGIAPGQLWILLFS